VRVLGKGCPGRGEIGRGYARSDQDGCSNVRITRLRRESCPLKRISKARSAFLMNRSSDWSPQPPPTVLISVYSTCSLARGRGRGGETAREQGRSGGHARRAGSRWSSPGIPLWCTCSNRTCTKWRALVPAVEMRPETEARRIAGLSDLPVTGIIGLLMQARCRSPRWVRRWKG